MSCPEDGGSNLSELARKLLITAAVADGVLRVAALIDTKRRPAREIRGGKLMWAAVIVLVRFAGVLSISCSVFGRRRQL
jgi:hypothetical protein